MKKNIVLKGSLFVFTAALLVYTAEILKQFSLLVEMTPFIFLLNVLAITAIQGIWYGIVGETSWTIGLTVLVVDAFSFINYFVTVFRGRSIFAVDLLSIGTALDVASGYEYTPPRTMLLIVAIHICWIAAVVFAGSFFQFDKKTARTIVYRMVAVVLSGAFLIMVSCTDVLNNFGITAQFFGGEKNGLLLNFLLSVKASVYQKPEGYSLAVVNGILNQQQEQSDTEQEERPDIIVIMNESFADLSVLGKELESNVEILPFYRSLEKNSAKGYALSSVWGGNTANSEFEFLTGNSMHFFPAGSVPYQIYIQQDTGSLVSHLKNMGYETTAIHPGAPDAWNRESVYRYLGFNTAYFRDDWEWEKIRRYESDSSCYQLIEKLLEHKEAEQPLFVFNVTIQNHAGYFDAGYQNTVSLQNQAEDHLDVEQYLSIINESDAALGQLINYLEQRSQKTVLLFFGDHQPKLNDVFVQEMLGGQLESLSQEQQNRLYYVPYLIWANYNWKEDMPEYTSINYLSNLLLQVAGLPYSRYNRFLEEMQQIAPVISAVDILANEQKNKQEQQNALQQYQLLTYYYLFQNGSSVLWS